MSKTVLFQTTRFSISTQFQCDKNGSISYNSVKHNYTVSMSKTVVFQTTQFSISTRFSSIRPINKILSGATTLGQSGPGSDGNEGVLRIPQSSMNYCNLTIRSFRVICRTLVERVLPLWRDVVSVFCSPNQLSNKEIFFPEFCSP